MDGREGVTVCTVPTCITRFAHRTCVEGLLGGWDARQHHVALPHAMLEPEHSRRLIFRPTQPPAPIAFGFAVWSGLFASSLFYFFVIHKQPSTVPKHLRLLFTAKPILGTSYQASLAVSPFCYVGLWSAALFATSLTLCTALHCTLPHHTSTAHCILLYKDDVAPRGSDADTATEGAMAVVSLMARNAEYLGRMQRMQLRCSLSRKLCHEPRSNTGAAP